MQIQVDLHHCRSEITESAGRGVFATPAIGAGELIHWAKACPPSRLAEYERLRCRVAFHALHFCLEILALGHLMVARLQALGQPYLSFNLGLVRDTLAYCGCAELFPVGLLLRAMGYPPKTRIYLAGVGVLSTNKEAIRNAVMNLAMGDRKYEHIFSFLKSHFSYDRMNVYVIGRLEYPRYILDRDMFAQFLELTSMQQEAVPELQLGSPNTVMLSSKPPSYTARPIIVNQVVRPLERFHYALH
ncbi:hypothetical protein RHMOL_Rhmol02G0287600 [Rhododendron molle]|uniref:Uncharacterized protein n=1 Tax=Rhododendron molle TaxID=49168 RepID=A0ACC0PUW7_RHOML|nr:hypothetical protein RHMOL_Rhmol02G0287600 [Rhododendron molle]